MVEVVRKLIQVMIYDGMYEINMNLHSILELTLVQCLYLTNIVHVDTLTGFEGRDTRLRCVWGT